MPDHYYAKPLPVVATAAELAAINADIAAGIANYPDGSLLRLYTHAADNGTPHTLRGRGRAASFVPDSTVAATTAAPICTSRPLTSGLFQIGQAITASTGVWDGAPTGYTYQWRQADGTAIPGATSATYIVQQSDLFTQPYCDVTATNATGSNTSPTYRWATVVPFVPTGSISLAAKFPKLALAIAAAQAGTRNASILCVGDSNTAGMFASGSNYANCKAGSYPTALAALIAQKYNVYSGNQVNDNCNTATFSNFTAFNPQFSFPAGAWGLGGGFYFGGRPLICGTGVGQLNYTPTQAFDTIEVGYTMTPSAGGFNISVDDGPSLGAATPTAGTVAINKVVRTCALGVHTLNIKRVDALNFPINWIRTWNSQAKGIEVLNAGAGSSTSIQWAAQAAATDASRMGADGHFLNLAPDLTIINLDKNDWGTAVTAANHKAQLTTIINAAKQTGDVLLTSATPQNSTINTNAAQANQDMIRVATEELAVSLNVPYVDVNLAFQRSWAYGFSQGWYPALGVDATGNHPLAVGYAVNSKVVYDYLVSQGL